MGRAANILTALENARVVSADGLARSLAITRRTLSSEVGALQVHLNSTAVISLVGGNYRLTIADPGGYRAVRSRISTTSGSFNERRIRISYIIGRLFRAVAPVRIEDLAQCMAVGRTTVVSDLSLVRNQLQPIGLSIQGRPNVGLELVGDELVARLHVLRHHFTMAYPPQDQLAEVEQLVAGECVSAGSGVPIHNELSRWAMVAVDRARCGGRITELPAYCAGIESTSAFQFASWLAVRLGETFRVELDPADQVFLSLPLVGMRPAPGSSSTSSEEVIDLLDEVLSTVSAELDLDLSGSDFLAEFAKHLAAMVNRMRYQMWVDTAEVLDLAEEFPLATQISDRAQKVIENRLGSKMDRSERGFLTAYFQVMLDSLCERDPRVARVAVVASAGQVFGELLSRQLKRILRPDVELSVVPAEQATSERLSSFDLIITSGLAVRAGSVAVIQISGISDVGALARELERIQLHVPLLASPNHRHSLLAGSLDDDHFFALPPGTEYREGVDFMLGHLETKGLIEQGFADRVRAGEARTGMQFGPWVGFPHASLEIRDEVMLAVAVVPRESAEPGVRLIVLLGVPGGGTRHESTLSQVYDAVLRIGSNRNLLNLLGRAKSFREFYYLIENHPM